MDAILTALFSSSGQLGAVGILIVLFGLYIRSSMQDRSDYREALKEVTSRHAIEIARVNGDHDSEIAELKANISELRKKLDELQQALDVERGLRRKAEDDAASMRRRGPRS